MLLPACTALYALSFLAVLSQHAQALSISLPESLTPWTRSDIAKRGTDKITIPAPISVPPSQFWDGNDGPWSSFPIRVGEHPQDVRVFVSTAAYTTWTIFDEGCPSGSPSGCENLRGSFFETNESLTWVPISKYDTGLEQNLGLDSAGDYGFDTVTLGFDGSGGPTVNHTTIVTLADQNWWLGLFGIKPLPSNFTTMADPQPSYLQYLWDLNMTASMAYAYTAGNQYQLTGSNFGSFVIGGYDQSKFVEDHQITVPFAGDISRDLVVAIQSIKSSDSSDSSLSSESFLAYIDSSIPWLYLPIDVCEKFESAFGLTYNDTTQLYLVNETLHETLVKQNTSVTFTLGASLSGGDTIDITFPYAAFDLNLTYPYEDSYYFPLRQGQNATQYTLGRAFLQEAYLIADYQRNNFTLAPCAWVQGAESNISTIIAPNSTYSSTSTNKSSSDLSGGAKAGIAVGVVALLAIVGIIVFFVTRRTKKRKAAAAELEATEARKRSDALGDASTAGYSISKPFGGELSGDSTLHEMDTRFKMRAQELDSPHRHDPSKHGINEMEGEGDAEYFGKMARPGHAEVEGNTPVYEMPGSDVQEMSTPRDEEKR